MTFAIPAIDLRSGTVVRLHQGRFERETRYAADPLSVASHWREQGAAWIHVVDLDGAVSGRPQHLPVLRRMVASAGGPIQFGGGVRSLADVEAVLDAGAERVILGSAALSQPDLVGEAAMLYGEGVLVAIDVRGGNICVSGWREEVPRSPMELAKQLRSDGLARIIYTDVTRDGTMQGPDAQGAAQIARSSGLAVIASGGVSSLDDVRKLAQLQRIGIDGAIVGRALYEGRFTLREAIEAAPGR